jgi:hypothetical protein
VLFLDIEKEAITCAPSRLGILMGGNKKTVKNRPAKQIFRLQSMNYQPFSYFCKS